MMYVPPLNAFLKNMDSSLDEFNSAEKITIPASLFRFLVQVLIAQGSFNEQGYLRANPDVAAAVKNGDISSARLHYIGYGFFEGREGATPEVDERWYKEAYPDVDQAVRNGSVESGSVHFLDAGAAEGRSPNAASESDALQWKRAFGRT